MTGVADFDDARNLLSRDKMPEEPFKILLAVETACFRFLTEAAAVAVEIGRVVNGWKHGMIFFSVQYARCSEARCQRSFCD